MTVNGDKTSEVSNDCMKIHNSDWRWVSIMIEFLKNGYRNKILCCCVWPGAIDYMQLATNISLARLTIEQKPWFGVTSV